jgi:hypothetical protein
MENKTKEEKKDVKVNTHTFSWLIPWVAGFLFTLGYVGVDPLLSTYAWYIQVEIWIISYFIWPLTLGMKLAGH